MLRFLTMAFATAVSFTASARASDDTEVSLFDGGGKPVAYVALTDKMTIYLWSGKPVAYLEQGDAGFDVYGFNGKHLGWFARGVIWDHDGDAACGTKDVMRRTDYEPYKSYKEYKPYRSYQEGAPSLPHLSGEFGSVSCLFLLAEGAS